MGDHNIISDALATYKISLLWAYEVRQDRLHSLCHYLCTDFL